MKKLLLKYSLLFSIVWTIVILILCSTPGRYIPTTSWLELLSVDKFVHASIFYVLVILWLLYLLKKNWISFLNTTLLTICCICYGGLLEIMQSTLFSERSGDWFDFIANSLGCLVGVFSFKIVKNKFLIE